jgi:hypothetical protein
MPKPRVVSTSEVTKSVRHPRWSASEARRVLSAQPAGTSLRAYADQLGRDVRRLYWWRARLARTDTSDASLATRFVPVTLSTPGAGADADVIEFQFPRGAHVRIGGRVPVEAVLRVLTFLERRSC